MTAPLPSSWRRASCLVKFSLLLLPALVLGSAALWMTLHRHEGYAYRCLPWADLYQLADSPRISNFSMAAPGRLKLEIENVDETRWVQAGFDETDSAPSGNEPVVALSPGIARVELLGTDSGETLSFQSVWGPEQPEPLVSHASYRIGEASPYALRDFVRSHDSYSAQELANVRLLLAPLKLDSLGSRTEKATLIAAFLHTELEPHRGQPSDHMRRLNGLEQYREALAGRSEVYCANHAEIFAFMANAVGIPTRLVDVAGRVGDAAIGAHSFVEIYLEPERRWVYMDLQMNLAGVHDAGRNPLSAAQVLARLRHGTTETLVAQTIRDGQIVEEPFTARSSLLETFLSPAASLVFLPDSPDRFALSERLGRLLFDPPAAICESGQPDRTAIRLGATWWAVAWGAFCLAIPVRHGLGRCSCRRRQRDGL